MRSTSLQQRLFICLHQFGRLCSTIAITGIFTPTISSALPAPAVIDQSFVPPSWTAYIVGSPSAGYFVEQAQTFKVGQPGLLTGIDVQVGRFGNLASSMTSSLNLAIKNVTPTGIPGNTVLATATVAPAQVPLEPWLQVSWVFFDLSAAPIAIQPGDKFAIALTSTSPANGDMGYGWMGGGAATAYPDGNGYGHTIGFSWNAHTFDFGFQTYVIPVPEPHVSGLLILIAGGLASFRRLYRKAPSPSTRPNTACP